jgi:hypothetical protein
MIRLLSPHTLGLIVLGCVHGAHAIHGECATNSECPVESRCVRWGDERGSEHKTCEIECSTDNDCPATMECVRFGDGPPQSCVTRALGSKGEH